MTHRDNPSGGGLTGATGDLTPDATDVAFDPAERREFGDPAEQAEMTTAQIRRAPAQAGEVGDPEAHPVEGPTNLASRDMGYASEHGLNPDDPAYRMEHHPGGGAAATESQDDAPRGAQIGGDELLEEEPRF